MDLSHSWRLHSPATDTLWLENIGKEIFFLCFRFVLFALVIISSIHRPPLPPQESPSGRRKALATSSINMKQYASPMPTQTDVKLKFKPLSKKVVSATLQFSLSCIFLREGKAT